MDPIVIVCLLVAFFFWIFRVLKMIYMVFKYLEMHAFYTQALKISLVGHMFFTQDVIGRLRILHTSPQNLIGGFKMDVSPRSTFRRSTCTLPSDHCSPLNKYNVLHNYQQIPILIEQKYTSPYLPHNFFQIVYRPHNT